MRWPARLVALLVPERWRAWWGRLNRLDRLRLQMWVALFSISVVLLAGMAAWESESQGRRHQVCVSVDYVIDYLRVFTQQHPITQEQQKQLRDAVLGAHIPAAQQRIVVALVDGLAAAERTSPGITRQHPFVLPDLPGCPTRPRP